MKKILIVLLILMFSVTAFGARLVSDPDPAAKGLYFEIWSNVKGVPEHMITVSGTLVTVLPNQPDGSIEYNLDDLAPGEFHWYIRYAQAAYVYGPNNTQAGGKTYSVFVPFDFTKRPPVAVTIKALRLVPE